jgi:hypothetical protein
MIKRTYIKILGPKTNNAIKELDKIAAEMPEFCIMNTVISSGIPSSIARDIGGVSYNRGTLRDPIIAEYAFNYFKGSGVILNKEQCERILSGSIDLLGDYDYFFEWKREFDLKDYENLVEKIDNAFTSLGCHYTIVNK